MGLRKDIKDAFLKSSGADKFSEDDTGNIDELAKDLTAAIEKYIKTQKFNIVDMEADVKLDKLQILTPITVNTSTLIPIGPTTGGSILPGAKLLGTALINPQTLNDNVQIIATGKAYLGQSAKKMKGSRKTDKFNKYAIVRLNPDSKQCII